MTTKNISEILKMYAKSHSKALSDLAKNDLQITESTLHAKLKGTQEWKFSELQKIEAITGAAIFQSRKMPSSKVEEPAAAYSKLSKIQDKVPNAVHIDAINYYITITE